MFKQATVFTILAGQPSHEALDAALQKAHFSPCAPTQELSAGWVSPRGEYESIFEVVNGEVIAKFVLERKSVPADVLKRQVDAMAAEVERLFGRKPGKKERRHLKEEAMFDLMPKAFPRRAEAFVWIGEGRLVVGSTSSAVVDAVVTSLVLLLDGFVVAPLTVGASPGFAMSLWLSEQAAPKPFELGDSCLLVSDDGKVKYTDHALAIDEVRAHIARGKVAASLALHCGGVSFELTDGLLLKKIKIEVGAESASDAVSDFDGNVVLHTGALRGLIDALVVALGGDAE